MFCELRSVRKLTAPLLTSGTAITKNTIITARNTQAHTRLSVRMKRWKEWSSPAEARPIPTTASG